MGERGKWDTASLCFVRFIVPFWYAALLLTHFSSSVLPSTVGCWESVRDADTEVWF